MFPAVFGVLGLVAAITGPLGVIPSRLFGLILAFVVARMLVHGTTRPLREYGWVRPSLRSVFGGMGLGFGLVTAVTVTMMVSGWFEPHFPSPF